MERKCSYAVIFDTRPDVYLWLRAIHILPKVGKGYGLSLGIIIHKTCEYVCVLLLVRKRLKKCYACVGGDICFGRRIVLFVHFCC